MHANPTSPAAESDGQTPRQILRRAGRALKIGRGLTSLAIGVVAAGVLLGAWLVVDARARFGALGRWAGLVAIALPLAAALANAAASKRQPHAPTTPWSMPCNSTGRWPKVHNGALFC
ncbi:MAG: hypothetical protein NTV46_17405 [Verrucomicrobia bacterium]|nr:hypothetical protein [Verrucomicrobiota bacterium]